MKNHGLKIKAYPILWLSFLLLFSWEGQAQKQLFDPNKYDSELDCIFTQLGLEKVRNADSTIVSDLKYSSNKNLVNRDMYGDLKEAYLQKEVLEMLVKAHKKLQSIKKGYRFIIFDAARPSSIQSIMWQYIDVPEHMKSKYVSPPGSGSLHNFGAAVDLSILNEKGEALDMGTPFDYFGKLAYPYFEQRMLKQGRLTQQQINNRKLLRKVMKYAGFKGITTEWWHFNAMRLKEAKRQYSLIPSHRLQDYRFSLLAEGIYPRQEEMTEDDLLFRIQIACSKKPLKKTSQKYKKYKGMIDFEYFHKGNYKYTTQKTSHLDEAIRLKKQVNKKLKSACFVAAFYKDKRISIAEARKLLKEI